LPLLRQGETACSHAPDEKFCILTKRAPTSNTPAKLGRPAFLIFFASLRKISMETQVGILTAACHLPAHRRAVSDLLEEEGAKGGPEVMARLGISSVPACNGESGSGMALAASQEALRRAGLEATQLDIIVDYTILPQEFLVPAWNMSNKLQHELGAKKAFTVGFSGGGASNFLVALSSAAALLQANENLKTALLVASDVTIPGSRVLNPGDPVSVLGDAASAVILQRGATRNVVVDTELWSDGANHDVYYIPGGALAHQDEAELYRMELDPSRYDGARKAERLRRLTNPLLERAGVQFDDVVFFLYPNISSQDQSEFQQAFGATAKQLCLSNRETHGHLQGSDFVLNYLTMLENGSVPEGGYVLAASHGMGFLAGVSLIRC
jgi:3-oxoacyl-[acyl-carrier-protein] synthase-3